jgi:O-antigen/teichoic acid export membrane protein
MIKTSARAFAYLPVLSVAMALLMGRLLLVARLLEVTEYAAYSLGLLVSMSFVLFGALGLYPLLQRDMPVFWVRRQQRRAKHLHFRAVHATLMLALLGLIGSFLVGYGSERWPALAGGVVNGATQQLFLLANTESKSRGESMRYALQNFTRGVLLILAAMAAARWLGNGVAVLLAEAAATLAMAAWLMRGSISRNTLHLLASPRLYGRPMWRRSWSSALLLLATSLAASALLYVDRWAAALTLDTQGFAQYSFAATVLLIAQSLQAMLNASVFPSLARVFAQTGRTATFQVAKAWSVSLSALGLLLSVPAVWSLSALIPKGFPAYTDTVGMMPLLVTAAAFRFADFWTSYLVVVREERRLLRAQIVVGSVVVSVWALATIGLGRVSPSAVASLALLLSAGWHLAAGTLCWHLRKP